MKIGELAKHSGLTASRIRFYEASGLIGKVQRQANGYREYPAQTLQLLHIITCAQQVGFTLDEIHHLLPTEMNDWHHAEILIRLKRKTAEIDTLQERLSQNKAQLLAIIDHIEHKAEDLTCLLNTEQVLTRLKHNT
jgi:DNA-binding transcriptional MerR regulator